METERLALLRNDNLNQRWSPLQKLLHSKTQLGMTVVFLLATFYGIFRSYYLGSQFTPEGSFQRLESDLFRQQPLAEVETNSRKTRTLAVSNTVLVPQLDTVPPIFDAPDDFIFTGTWTHETSDENYRKILPSADGGPIQISFDKVGPNRRPVMKVSLWNSKYIDQPRLFLTANMAFSKLVIPSNLVFSAWSGLEYFVSAEHHTGAFRKLQYRDFELFVSIKLVSNNDQPLPFMETDFQAMKNCKLVVSISSRLSLMFQVSSVLSLKEKPKPSGWQTSVVPLLMILFSFFMWPNLAAVFGELNRVNFAQQVGMVSLTMILLLYLQYIFYHSALLPQYTGFLFASHLLVLIFQFFGLACLWLGFLVANVANWGLGYTNRIAYISFFVIYIWIVGKLQSYIENPSIYTPMIKILWLFPILQVLTSTFIQPHVQHPQFCSVYYVVMYLNLAIFGSIFNGFDNSYFNLTPVTGLLVWIWVSTVLGSSFVYLQKKYGTNFAFPWRNRSVAQPAAVAAPPPAPQPAEGGGVEIV